MLHLFCIIHLLVGGSSAAFTPGSFGDSGLYKVVIDKTRVPLVDVQPVQETLQPLDSKEGTVVMRNRKGQPFRCTIPEVQPKVDDRDKLVDLSTEAVETALKPAESNRGCVQLVTSGWWHYEFCYNKHVRQYHLENNVISQPVISLGVYSHSLDWSSFSTEELLQNTDRYHAQVFVNGSECDITGIKRQTTVKFFCDPANWASDIIQSVKEPESCVYEVVVFSKRLCSIPYFKKEDPVVGKIVCNPIGLPKTQSLTKEITSRSEDVLPSTAKLGQSLMDSLLSQGNDDDANLHYKAEADGTRLNVDRTAATDQDVGTTFHQEMKTSERSTVSTTNPVVDTANAKFESEPLRPQGNAALNLDFARRWASDKTLELMGLDKMATSESRPSSSLPDTLEQVTQTTSVVSLPEGPYTPKVTKEGELELVIRDPVDWSKFEPMNPTEQGVLDDVIVTEAALLHVTKNAATVDKATKDKVRVQTMAQMEKIGAVLLDDFMTAIRPEFSTAVLAKMGFWEDSLLGTLNADRSTTREPRAYFDRQEGLGEQFSSHWAKLHPLKPREGVVHKTLIETTARLKSTLTAETDIDAISESAEKAAVQIGVVAKLIANSDDDEIRPEVTTIVTKEIGQVRGLIADIRKKLSRMGGSLDLTESKSKWTPAVNIKGQPGYVDWTVHQPFNAEEAAILDILISIETSLDFIVTHPREVGQEQANKAGKVAESAMDEIWKMAATSEARGIPVRTELLAPIGIKFAFFVKIRTRDLDRRAPKRNTAKTEAEEQYTETLDLKMGEDWDELRPVTEREESIIGTLENSASMLLRAVEYFHLFTPDAVEDYIKKTQNHVEIIADLVESSSVEEVREAAVPLINRKIDQMEKIIERLTRRLNGEKMTERSVLGADFGQLKKYLTATSTAASASATLTDEEQRFEQMIETDATTSVDEKSVLKLLASSLEETRYLDDKDISGTVKIERQQFAISYLDDAEELLDDPKRDISEKFRADFGEKIKTMRDTLFYSRSLEESIQKMGQARKELTSGKISFEEWNKKYGLAIKNAKAVQSLVARKREGGKLTKLAEKADKLRTALMPPQPTSKATTFKEVVAEMDPAHRKLKEIQNMLREKFATTFGQDLPVEIKILDPPSKMRGQVQLGMEELELIRSKLAGVFANQLQTVYDQQRGVDEMEDNYNLEEQNDDGDHHPYNMLHRLLG